MRVSLRDTSYPCTNCGREFPANKLDRRMWCPDCRGVVVRRSAVVARVLAIVCAGALAFWVYWTMGPSPRYLAAYMVMIAAAYYFIYKLTQRVAFEVIRARGVRPPIPASEAEREGESKGDT